MRRVYTRDEFFAAIKELKHERMLASCDFYPNRRMALDLAIRILEEKAEEFDRQE